MGTQINNKAFILISAALLLALVFSLGCVTTQPTANVPQTSGSDDEQIRILFQQAESYYKNRFYDKALDRYDTVVESAPASEFAAPSLYKIGGIYMRQKRYDKAILAFDRISSEYPRSQYAIEAYYNKGYCYLKTGDAGRAVDALEDYLVRGNAKHKVRGRIYLAQARGAQGAYDEALVNYAIAAADKDIDKDDLVEVLTDVKDLVDNRTEEKDLTEALRRAPDGYVSDYLRFRMALRTKSAGDEGAAVAHLRKIDFGRARFSFYKDADRLLIDLGQTDTAIVDDDKGPSYTVGVVLPLSGRFAPFGEQVLHGIMLGVDFYGRETKNAPRIEVIVKDSQGQADAAVQAVDELAGDPRVIAIIGPLMKDPALAAARQAQEQGINLITLATHEQLPDTGDWVFRNAMTLSMQVKTLIKYAHNQKGCRRFAVLHPDNKLGNTYATLFARYMPNDSDITVSVGYDEQTTDFRQSVYRMRGGGSFDAIFIPDEASTLSLLAPQLVYFGIKGKVLLGTPGWNQDILARKAKGYLDDTVIVDSFFVGSTKPVVRAFVDRYISDFGEEPTHLAGHGYDTIAILIDRLAQGYGESRSTLRSGLIGLREFPGVTGLTTMMENGDVDKSLTLLRVGTDGIEELF